MLWEGVVSVPEYTTCTVQIVTWFNQSYVMSDIINNDNINQFVQ